LASAPGVASAAVAPADAAAEAERVAKKKLAKAIKSTVTVHDRTQIETVFDYSLASDERPKKSGEATAKRAAAAPGRADLHYRVEAFLFYPRQFGLDANSYPKERFYNDIRPLIRFREPRLGYKQLLGLKADAPRSPLLFLKEYLSLSKQGMLIEPVRNAVDETRLFACSFVSCYLRNLDRVRKKFSKLQKRHAPADDPEVALAFARLTRTLEKAHSLAQEFRGLFDLARDVPGDIAEAVHTELRLVDEYCYYRLRDGIAFLLMISEGYRLSGVETPEMVAFQERVNQVLSFHDDHADRHGYLRVRPDSPDDLKERYLHRRGELKRRIWGVLFLEIRTVPLFRIQRQIGAMVAAGMAASWAVIAQFIIVRKAMLSDNFSSLWGISGFLFLTAAVLAYVIKDRIKEIGRGYLGRGIIKKIPDHSERIYYANRQGDPIAIGAVKETAQFLKLGEIPGAVGALRQRLAVGDALEDEAIDHVLHYSKDISLSSSTRILNRYPLRAVHDILRFNIDACLPRLGEPTRVISIAERDGSIAAVPFPKVYYLDMALRYSRLGAKGDPDEMAVEYFRMVLDKNGLQRVERLS
jgi:hypothetical protein